MLSGFSDSHRKGNRAGRRDPEHPYGDRAVVPLGPDPSRGGRSDSPQEQPSPAGERDASSAAEAAVAHALADRPRRAGQQAHHGLCLVRPAGGIQIHATAQKAGIRLPANDPGRAVPGVQLRFKWESSLSGDTSSYDGGGRCGASPSPCSPPARQSSATQTTKAMIARHRGEHDSHWGRWRPSAGRQPAAALPRQIDAVARDPLAHSAVARRREDGRARHRRRGVVRWPVMLTAAIVAAYLTASLVDRSPAPASPQLPASPRAWLDAYEAAAIDNPGRVCSELFARCSPRLTGTRCAAAAAATSGGSRASRSWFGGCCRTAAPLSSSCARPCVRETGRWC